MMLKNYLKISLRNILRNKLFSFVNIIGLSVSMSVGLLLISFLYDLHSYDGFNKKIERIYRVNTDYYAKNKAPLHLASTSYETCQKIKESVPGLEDLTILKKGFIGKLNYKNHYLSRNGLWADNSFLNVFTFPMVKGNPNTALKKPYSMVLSETTAHELFGEANPIGETVLLKDHDYIVTGVMKDVPKFSHIQFDMLGSYSTTEILNEDRGNSWSLNGIAQNYVYVLFPSNANPENIQRALDHLSEQQNDDFQDKGVKIALSLQPLNGIVLGKDFINPIGPTMIPGVLWVLGTLAFIILVSACFNYTNLSLARSLMRSKEVGVRKVIGAGKSQIFIQFITESILTSLFGLALAILLFYFIRPRFLSLDPGLRELLSLKLFMGLLGCFLIFAVFTGFVAGIFPSLIFSKIKAINAFRKPGSMRLYKNVNPKKVLVVCQYIFSLIFITITVLGIHQYKFFLNFNLGFNINNIRL